MSEVILTIYFEINESNYQKYCTEVQNSSKLSFTEKNNLYVPTVYTSEPSFTNNLYIPPPGSYAYYDLAPLTVYSIKNITTPSGQTSRTLPIVYEVEYILLSTDLKSSIKGQIDDFLNVYNSVLGSTFSILTSSQSNTSNINFQNLISNFCKNSNLMGSNLCSSETLGFSNIKIIKSPCIDPYTNCQDSWNNYCFNDMNFDSEECINYYQNSYDGNLINHNVSNKLVDLCQSLYDSNTTQSETFWNTCACFMPDSVYTKFLEDYKLTGLTLGSPQCWYPKCMLSNSIKPEQSPKCPNSTVSVCMQNSYTDLVDEDGNIDDNTLNINQVISKCTAQTGSSNNSGSSNSSGSSNNSSTGGDPSSNNSSSGGDSSSNNNPIQQSSSILKWLIPLIIVIIVIIILGIIYIRRREKGDIGNTTTNSSQNITNQNSKKPNQKKKNS